VSAGGGRPPRWRDPRRLWRERRPLAIALLAGAVAVAAGGVAGYEVLKRPPDVQNVDVTFKPEKPKKQRVRSVNWPRFGYDLARSRYLPAKGIKPPYRLLWRYNDKPLLEFPPVFARGRLYTVNNNGMAFALDADTGRVLWERRVGRLNASSPAYHRGRLYIVNLVPGHVLKLDAKTGRVLWKRSLPDRAESSPLVIGRTLYFGCEDGQVGPRLPPRRPLRRRLRRIHERCGCQERQVEMAKQLAWPGVWHLGRVLLDTGGRLRSCVRRQ
jgi:glucose dehydrogenase